MRTIKDLESIYTRMFKWHETERYNVFEKDVADAITAEIQRQNGCGDMEGYKLIYRRVLNWHEEHAFPKNCEDLRKMVDSFGQFDESSSFEAALICAAAEEIQRNYYNENTSEVIN